MGAWQTEGQESANTAVGESLGVWGVAGRKGGHARRKGPSTKGLSVAGGWKVMTDRRPVAPLSHPYLVDGLS